ncbi:epithelial-stromal interaction protein 1 isoform X1 [Neovison vison]|uniref:epithelial-stromal interaction protein 1 isoform X1 n=1 Tax=Neovison vison TaxID=452646 RepID=UPI001CF06F5A|nr:epithelial-stromal interaction protein 1 isoform X1 [Neogale vison]
MFTRTRVVGSGLGASPAPGLTRDFPGLTPEPGRLQGPRPGLEVAPQSPARESRGLQSQRVPGAYTMIVPNENRRNQIKRSTYIYSVNIQNASRLLNRVGLVYLVAEQELESLEKWKEQHRAKPVNLAPRRLGGSQSEAEVRQKQQLQLMQSKYQQKLKREESVRIKKEAEEAEMQKMKAIQREKSNKLEEKKRLQENLRREAFREHRQYKTAEFLSRLAAELPDRSTHQIALHDPQSSTWARSRAYKDSLKEEENKKLQKMKEEQHQKSELLEFKRQQQEEERTKTHQAEHRRVNNVFLDRLQGKSQPGGFEHFGGHWNTNSGNSWVSFFLFS